MRIPLAFLFFLSFLTPLHAEQEILVPVATAQSGPPVAIRWAPKASSYSREVAEQILSVLSQDLLYGGRCSPISCTSTAPLQDVRQVGARFVIDVSQEGQGIVVRVLDSQTGKISSLEPQPIRGKLDEDRAVLHQISDTLHKILFGQKGIAQGKILYTVQLPPVLGKKAISEVWECDYDGARAHPVLKEGCLCVTPTYLPFLSAAGGRDFLFVSYQVGQPKIYRANTHGGSSQRVSYLKGNQLMPTLSPKRDYLAFISDAGGNPDLFIQSFDPMKGLIGKPKQLYAAPMATQGSPSFSPDGKQIAFVSNKDGTPRIYMIDTMGGGHPQLISKKHRDNTSPAWSPDGTKIAYCAQVSGIRQIWMYDLVQKKECALTEGPMHKENPTWAPDSFHLMFNTAVGDQGDLFLTHLHAKKPIQITKGPGEKRFPSWEPRG